MRFEISKASECFDPDLKPHEKAELDAENKRWVIDINTVEELVNLDSNGVVVNPDNKYNPLPTIMIYDDYIE